MSVARIDREINVVSHELAKMGRARPRTAVWLGNVPEEIAHHVAHDCNSISP